MAHVGQISVSLTETAQFRRLVDFVFAVNAHATETGDETLQALVADLRGDLLDMTIG